MWVNRTVCEVLSEMRKAHETHNYSYMLGLIEEVQSMANRMEARLQDQNDEESLRESIKRLKKEKDKLRTEVEDLKDGRKTKA